MKKITAVMVALVLGLLALAGPAAAGDNKEVTFCHATGADGKFNKLTLPLQAFLNGHYDHTTGSNPDIWAAFSYTTAQGQVVDVPANGSTSLLAFADCVAPAEDEKIPKPSPVSIDECGTDNDTLSVAPGRGYTVSPVAKNGLVWTITVTLADGFAWADGTKTPLVFPQTFTSFDCDPLPATGIGESFNTTSGYLALGAVLLGGVMLLTGGRRRVRA